MMIGNTSWNPKLKVEEEEEGELNVIAEMKNRRRWWEYKLRPSRTPRRGGAQSSRNTASMAGT
jgi:hypothetical protein